MNKGNHMGKLYKKVIATVGMVAVCTTAAEATPAFARQMNADCMTCHYQNIPKLNSFGREFKLSGFTMTGGVKEIVSESKGGVALPSNLNMAFVIKARYHDVKEVGGTAGTHEALTEIYDESAFIFGGKIAENVGTSMEFIHGLAGGKIVFSKPTALGRVGLSVFMTDGLGAFSGLETMSTGLYRPIRQFENRSRANIFQKLGIGDGAAQGLQAYYSGYGFFATVGQYVPVYGRSTVTSEAGHKLMARASYEMDVAGFNIALGGYYMGGDVRDNNATGQIDGDKVVLVDGDAYDRKSTGVDLQIEGNVGSMSLMVTGAVVLSNEYTAGGTIGTAPKDSDKTGYSLGVQLNPVDNWGVKLAYLSSKNNKDTTGNSDENIITIGTDYNVAQNVRLCLEYSDTAFSDSTLTNQKDILFMTNLAF